MMVAAQHNQVETLTLLWSEGADDSILDSQGDSVLSWACYGGSAEAARFLLCRGEAGVSPTCAKPAAADKHAMNAMHLAVLKNGIDSVSALLMHETAAEMLVAKDNKGRTPLDIAKEKGHP